MRFADPPKPIFATVSVSLYISISSPCFLDLQGSPFSFIWLISLRNRDDLTVEVIFFGEGDNSGDVVRNPDASASNIGLKAKL